MAKLSFIKWYPTDWIQDTRCLSLAAKGAWIDLLNFMWNSKDRGIWTGTYEELSWLIGCTVQAAQEVAKELGKVADVTIVNVSVTVKNRRMIREETIYKNASERQARYRSNANNDRRVTAKTLDVRLLKTLDTQDKDIKNNTLDKSARAAPSRSLFTKPSLEEITAYARSIGFDLNASRFFDFYESNGWRVGKNAMKNWQAAIRTWRQNDFGGGKINASNGGTSIHEQVIKRFGARKPTEIGEELTAGQVLARIRDLPQV